MPELPEVETIVRELRSVVVGQEFLYVEVIRANVVRTEPALFIKALAGAKILRLERRAKWILLAFQPQHPSKKNIEQYLLIHLRMTGRLVYQPGKDQAANSHKNTIPAYFYGEKAEKPRVIFGFKNNAQLIYYDQRTLGRLEIVNASEYNVFEAKQGIEPLSIGFILKTLRQMLAGKSTEVKNFLLNQSLIAGIGNIYASEILFRAQIHPESPAGELSARQVQALYKAIIQVLQSAIENNGTTFKDFRRSDNKKGGFQDFLQVYARANQPCRVCGAKIQRLTQAQRSTFLCPRCQSR